MTTHSDAFAEALDGESTDFLDDAEMLFVIVDRLRALPGEPGLAEADLRPEFRAELRGRLLEAAGRHSAQDTDTDGKVVPIASRWNQTWARRNRMRLVSGIAAGVVGLAAVSIAASSSLPGSPFYQLKRGSESVQYAMAGSDEQRGNLEFDFARARLHEIDRLTEHNAAYGIVPTTAPQAAGGGTVVLAESVASKVVHLFADMDKDAAQGSTLLTKSFKGDPRPGPMLAVQQFAKDQAAALTTLRVRLAEPALSKATHSLAWATLAVKTTTAVLATCNPGCPPSVAAAIGGSVVPSLGQPIGPSIDPTPSAPVSVAPVPSVPGVPSGLPSISTSVPPTPAVTSPQPTPGPTTGQPTGGVTTSQPPTEPQPTTGSPTETPTSTPSTGPTDSPPPTTTPPTPTRPPTPSQTTDPAPPTSPVVVETTPPAPPTPSTAPPAPSTTPDPTTQAPPPSSPAPSSPAPTTTPEPTATRTSRPPLICLPPNFLVNGICIRGPLPPGVGSAVT